MPGAAARNTESTGGPVIFSAPVLQWLLQHECRGIHLLEGPATAGEWTTAPVGPHGSDVGGWCFGWPDGNGGERRLLLAFARPEALTPDERAHLAGYVALAATGGDGDGGNAVLMDGDAVGRRIHDLRNALNSLLMNVAVLTTKLPPDDRAGRFATQAQADGERCAALLQALVEALRPPDEPLSR